MNKSIIIGVVSLLITACSVQPPEPTRTTLPISTATSIIANEAVAPTGESQPDNSAGIEEVGSAGVVTYKIIPNESRVTYEVGETFLNQNNRFAVAVGVTTFIEGEISANLSNPPMSGIGIITIDISQFTSDSGRRDSAIRGRWLESEKYPLAVFTPTSITGLPETYEQGMDYGFVVSGDLKVRDVTNQVVFDVTARLNDTTLSGVASTTILMSDFGVGPISIGGVLNTEDEVKLTLDFIARPQ